MIEKKAWKKRIFFFFFFLTGKQTKQENRTLLTEPCYFKQFLTLQNPDLGLAPKNRTFTNHQTQTISDILST